MNRLIAYTAVAALIGGNAYGQDAASAGDKNKHTVKYSMSINNKTKYDLVGLQLDCLGEGGDRTQYRAIGFSALKAGRQDTMQVEFDDFEGAYSGSDCSDVELYFKGTKKIIRKSRIVVDYDERSIEFIALNQKELQ